MGFKMVATYVRLLGGGGIRVGTSWIPLTAEKRLGLLAHLAYEGDWVTRDRLLYLFWPDRREETARRNLRQTLHKLKKLSWLGGLEVESSRLRWEVPTDVAAFKEALRDGTWQDVVDLYRGPLLEAMDAVAETEFGNWVALEREHLQGLWRDALLRQTDALAGSERHAEAAALFGRLLEQDEFDEQALKSYMAASGKAGRHDEALAAYRRFAVRLHDELQLEPSLASQQLAESLADGNQPVASASYRTSTPEAVPPDENYLPVAATPFVGRRPELTELGRLLAIPDCRLLTLIGSGGAGKSRIALQAALELSGGYGDGSCFVPLEGVSSPGLIPAKIAETLDLSLHGHDDPAAQVRHHLRHKRLLLVLDNFEHLIEGSSLLSELVQSCAHLQVLVTSRERTALEEEWLLPIEGLAFPETPLALEEALQYDAVSLFVQCAKRVKPDFHVGAYDIEHVVTVCRLVEGLPLAIELAAAWIRLMTCAEMAREIRQTSDFLTSTSRKSRGRHQSIRATFEHSWNLLTVQERAVLRKMSVFFGGFRLEAGRYVAGASLALLASLVDKSLLRVMNTSRYDRHPLLYEYMLEKLAEHPEEAQVARESHGRYYLAMLEGRKGRSQDEILRDFDDELENILVAWRWAIASTKAEELLGASEAFAQYFEVKGRFEEGAQSLAEASAAFDESNATHRRVLGHLRVRQAWLEHWRENVRAAWLAREGLRLLRPLPHERRGVVGALRVLGITAWRTGRFLQAESCFREALGMLEAPSVVGLKAIVLDALGLSLSSLGHYEEAQRCHRDALAINQRLGNHFQIVHNLVNLASFLWRIDDPRVALELAQRALALATENGFEQYLPYCLAEAGWSHLALNQPEEAEALGREAQLVASRHGDTFALSLSLLLTAQAALDLGKRSEAARCLQQGMGVAWSIRDRLMMLRALRVAASLALCQGRLECAAQWVDKVMRHPASPHWNSMDAQRLVPAIRDGLGEDLLAQAQRRSKAVPLEDMIESILAEVPD